MLQSPARQIGVSRSVMRQNKAQYRVRPQNEGFTVMHTSQWPPPIKREPPEPKFEGNKPKSWHRPFFIYLGSLYFLFTSLLIYFFVPSLRNAVEAMTQYQNRPPPSYFWNFHYLLLLYYAPPFHFAAACLAVASGAGSLTALWQFAVAVNSRRRFILATLCFFASLLPGSLAFYLVYLEYGYL